jgi:glycosyltransferase involved in cell wall biosynthesis
MTAYNRERYIGEAIESVLSSVLTDFELIIVDDRSKDGTVDIIEQYLQRDKRIKFFRNENNLGDYPNRNKAAGYASGKYIKYLDSDDVLYPHCLDVMVRNMEMFPEAGFGLSAKTDPAKPYPVLLSPRDAYKEHFNGYGHFDRAPGSSIIKKTAFDKVGGFSGERMIGDTDLWFRLAMSFPMVKIVPDLYWSRLHEGQESQSSYAQQQYGQLRQMVLDRYFSNALCPLNDEEKAQVRADLKRRKKKAILVSSIKKIFR